MAASRRHAGPSRREASTLPPRAFGEVVSFVEKLRRHTTPMTQAAAAKILGVDRSTVCRAVKAHQIPVVNPGFGDGLIDPVLWLQRIELLNPHLVFIEKAHAAKVHAAA